MAIKRIGAFPSLSCAICMMSGEGYLKRDFGFNLTLEIQLLNMLILGADFLCWLAERIGGSLFPFPKCWPCQTWQAQRGHSEEETTISFHCKSFAWSFKTINHLPDLVIGVLMEKSQICKQQGLNILFFNPE